MISFSTLQVLAFAFAYGVCSVSSDVPQTQSAGNPEATRIRVEDVSPYSQVFLSDMKTAPAFDMGNGMTLRLEVEEPSDDDKTMNAARKAIGETPAVMEAAKKKLASMLKNDGELNVPWQNDAWLIRFLRLRNYDVPKTYKLIKSYYNLKIKGSEMLGDLVPSELKEIAEQEVVLPLPNRDPARSRIMIVETKQWNPKKYPLMQFLRLGVSFAEIAAYEPATQLAGIQIIFNGDGLTWQHIKQFNPSLARLIIQWMMTSSPIKVRGIHIINQPSIFGTLLNIFKPFMSGELKNKVHFHGSNMKSLHRYVPAESLPNSLGGSFPKPKFSGYEWETLLKSGDEELAKIQSYGMKRRA